MMNLSDLFDPIAKVKIDEKDKLKFIFTSWTPWNQRISCMPAWRPFRFRNQSTSR